MTVPFFPTPYPDELFNSLIARYRTWSKNSFTQTRADLLPTRHTNVGIGLHGRLQHLCKQLPSGSMLKPEIIIRNHSILPVFYPFLEDGRLSTKICLSVIKSSQ